MGCTSSTNVEPKEQAPADGSETGNVGSSKSYPVPFGHVPYCPSLPGAMGPLLDFPTEWWYYGGWAYDRSVPVMERFTIVVVVYRFAIGSSKSLSAILYGIGGPSSQEFATQCSAGSFTIPHLSSTTWSLEANTDLPKMTCRSELTSGILGLSGAMYTFDLQDETNGVSASFVLKDTFGMVLEGASGAVGPDSYEFAMPSLTINSGAITMHGVKTEIGGGNLWLDRQTIGKSGLGSPYSPRALSYKSLREQLMQSSLAAHAGSSPSELYVGNWLAVVMNDQRVYMLVFFWPTKKNQWIVGSELHPPVPPSRKLGLEYPPLPNGDQLSPVQGVNVLDSTEFDLNLLDPSDPEHSPHWTSQKSQQTYCSAWRLRIRNDVHTMKAWVPGSEVQCGAHGQFCFEGAATLTNSGGSQVGHVFVEQMGYTQ